MTEYEFHIEYANTKSELDIGSINQLKLIINSCAKDIILRLFKWFDISDCGFKLPIIVFDDSCPTDAHYDGDLSVYDVRNALIALLSEYPDLDSSLRQIILGLNYAKDPLVINETLNIIRSSLTEILFDLSASASEKEFAKRAGGIIIRYKTDDPVLTSVLGRYHPKSNIIFLYYNNWGDEYDHNNTRILIAKIILTLARELFHAFHYFMAGKEFLSSGDHPEVVKEASADFFALFYCLIFYSNSLRSNSGSSFDEAVDEVFHRYSEWKECFISKWPCSKALYYLRLKDTEPIDANYSFPLDYDSYVKYGSIEKLRGVIRLSKYNMDDAYHALIYDVDDYIIPYSERTGKKFSYARINSTQNSAQNSAPSKQIVEFTIVHHPGSWGQSKPIGYTIKMSDCEIDEIHYKTGGFNPREDSRIKIKADSHLTEDFFRIVNDLDWSKNYKAPAFDGGSWDVTLIYNNQSRKTVTGTSTYSPDGAAQLTSLFKKMYAIAGCTKRPYIF